MTYVKMSVTVHDVERDGYPDMEALTGRVAFIWDGYIVSGWPLHNTAQRDGTTYPEGTWEPADDRFGGPVRGVTHWVEFPIPLWDIAWAPEALEPTRDAVERCVVSQGTYKFKVAPKDVASVRGRLGSAQRRSGHGSMATRYDAVREVLTVEVTL